MLQAHGFTAAPSRQRLFDYVGILHIPISKNVYSMRVYRSPTM
jgi:hypothetical protein